MSAPLALVLGSILYFVYKRISLESQLVDNWWKVDHREVELVTVRRKNAGDGSVIIGSAVNGSTVSSQAKTKQNSRMDSIDEKASTEFSGQGKTTIITRATDASGAFTSSAADMCYGEINLGIYKLNKVALKPIAKFHKSRKLMIELRTVSIIVV